MILGRRELSVGLLMFGAVISIYLVLLAGPTSAQNGGGTTGIVVDFSVDVVQGECGAGECPDGTRPVTFEPELRVNVSESRQDLDAQEIEAVNEILEGADVEVTVQVPGPDETVETGEPVCLESGQYEFTAEILNEGELATAIDGVIDGSEFMEEELVIEEFEDTFVVEECPDDNNGDTIDIDDRDQTNVCNNVVNIILDDVQNPDVDIDNDQVVSGPVSGNVSGDVSNEQVVEVSNEQVVDIAQELNISPVIVQQCIQQNAGRDAIIIVDDDNNNDSNNNNDGNNNDDTGNANDVDDDNPTAKPSNVLNEITTKDLPNTGGFSFVTRGTALMVVFGVALLALRLVAARRESR